MVNRFLQRTDVRRLLDAYSIDPRSLALLRILVGLGFTVTRVINLPWVEEFYTDRGSFPRSFSVLLISHPHGPSLLQAVGEPPGVFFLYFLAILAGLAVAVGYKTRVSTPCCFILAASVYNRCPAVNPASDAEILLCLLFGIFLPWGDLWSVDHPFDPKPSYAPYHSMAVLGWRIQVSALYITASLSKTSYHWGNGSATMVSMHSDNWSSPFGRWVGSLMSPYPVITRELTNQVVSAEFLLPILLLIPVARLQLAAIVGLVVMHSCFGLALHLEAFTPLAIVCMAGFIPRLVWNRWSGVQRAFERFFHLFGRFSLCGPSGERFKALGSISSAFLTWGTLGILWSCASATNSAPPPASDKIMEPWHVFSLQQGWGMFVPPPFQGGWYVFRGKTMRGDWVNLEVPSGFADSLGRPEPMDQNVPSSRHYLLYNSLLFKAKQMQPLQEKVALNFRLRWEQDHPGLLDRLQQVEIYRYYREYDSEADKFSTPELYYSYKKITL